MGGLGHFLEQEGLATTQISLIREHTERIRPPRALWVPFELGRPLGVPGDPAFQRRVLRAALGLFARESGPVLEDFPEDAPEGGGEPALIACPVSFSPGTAETGRAEGLRGRFLGEMERLRPWYDQAVRDRGRTTVGVSGLSLEELGKYIGAFVVGEPPRITRADMAPADLLKLAAEDLKAYYLLAALADPGRQLPQSQALADWFWNRTAAGEALRAVKEACQASPDQAMQVLGRFLLVPMGRT